MAGYALIRDERVVNIVEWDGVEPFDPGPGGTLVPVAEARADPDVTGGAFLPEADAAA